MYIYTDVGVSWLDITRIYNNIVPRNLTMAVTLIFKPFTEMFPGFGKGRHTHMLQIEADYTYTWNVIVGKS